VFFVLDAAVTLWRRGSRSWATIVGSTALFFVVRRHLHSAGGRRTRSHASHGQFVFFPIALAMSYRLGSDVLRAAELARQLRASEAVSHEREGRFRVLADTAPVMVWMSDADRFCSFFNKPWLEFTGRTMDQELGNGCLQRVHAEDLQQRNDTYVSSFNVRQPFTMEYRLRRADGAASGICPQYKAQSYCSTDCALSVSSSNMPVSAAANAETENNKYSYEGEIAQP